MTITEIKIRKLFGTGRIRAIVSIILDGDFAVHDLKVIEGSERLFVAMPNRRSEDGRFQDIVHPITSEARRTLEDAVLSRYREAAAEREAERQAGRDARTGLPAGKAPAQAPETSGAVPPAAKSPPPNGPAPEAPGKEPGPFGKRPAGKPGKGPPEPPEHALETHPPAPSDG